MKKISWLIAILAVFSLLLVGCGNGDKDNDGTSDPSNDVVEEAGPVEIDFYLTDAEFNTNELESLTTGQFDEGAGNASVAAYIYFREPVDVSDKTKLSVTATNGSYGYINLKCVYAGTEVSDGGYETDDCGTGWWNVTNWGGVPTTESIDLTKIAEGNPKTLIGCCVDLMDNEGGTTWTITSVTVE